jgi:hypothetical protein
MMAPTYMNAQKEMSWSRLCSKGVFVMFVKLVSQNQVVQFYIFFLIQLPVMILYRLRVKLNQLY